MKFGELRKNMPETLKISPVAMIPHKSRDFQTILDLSFKLKINGTEMPSVNKGTVLTAPQHSMNELGRVVECMIVLMAVSPIESPDLLFLKLDIKGFWRVKKDKHNAYNFYYVLPPLNQSTIDDIDDVYIAISGSLQMGWTESPPFFLFSNGNVSRYRRTSHQYRC